MTAEILMASVVGAMVLMLLGIVGWLLIASLRTVVLEVFGLRPDHGDQTDRV